MSVRPFLTALALCLTLGACSDEKPVGSPVPPAPGPKRPAAVRAEWSEAARAALASYLHAIASGDKGACALLAPEYERIAFGRPKGCAGGLRAARARLRPQDLKALRTVAVPTAEPGMHFDEVSVPFQDLAWKGEPARPGGLLAARYTLRKSGKRWLITG
ncbi:hypothetical protein [Actinomadura macrotermitis]|uniref:DUF4440 domain-containing protein n=1 Tax=Actinomadura macrotermitis TaxID=2585200 RepID=A0A7K0C2N0_9ACTN|nr:hypothetical protein [Actinomadura macrotermitis]MQY07084.1 hypothetical protein [Actinomadura macrotermitis]